MNTETIEQSHALTLPQRAAVALGETANEARLRELVKKSADIMTVANPDGRDQAHRAGMVLRNTRTNIRSTGKAAREDAAAYCKAVIAMENDLVDIIEPEELRVIGLRDAYDAKVKAERDAAIAAERARVDVIQERIKEFETMTMVCVGKDSRYIASAISAVTAREISEEFEEFATQAAAKKVLALTALQSMFDAAADAEAEDARIKAEREAEDKRREEEAARLKAEREELDRLRAEQERIASEERAKQEVELATQRAEHAAKLAEQERAAKAEQVERHRLESIERDRIAAEQAEAARKIKEVQDELAAKAAELARQQAEIDAAKQKALAEMTEADFNEALGIQVVDATCQVATEHDDERARLQDCADQMLADARETDPDYVQALMIAALQNAHGLLSGAHNDHKNVLEHIELALDAAGEPYQAEDVA